MSVLDWCKIKQSGRWCTSTSRGDDPIEFFDNAMPRNATRVTMGDTVIEPGPNAVVVLEDDFFKLVAELDEWRRRVGQIESAEREIRNLTGVLDRTRESAVAVTRDALAAIDSVLGALTV